MVRQRLALRDLPRRAVALPNRHSMWESRVVSVTREWMLKLPWEKPPMSLNDRDHHRVKARKTKDIRETVGWVLRAAHIPPLERVRVQMVWTVPDRIRRDEDNPAATLKAVCDAFVDVGVVPDDVPKFMEKLTTRIEYAEGVRSVTLHIVELAPL